MSLLVIRIFDGVAAGRTLMDMDWLCFTWNLRA
jgi:hypothetical protein